MAGRFGAVSSWRKRRGKGRDAERVHVHKTLGADLVDYDFEHEDGTFPSYQYESEEEDKETVMEQGGMFASYPEDIRQLSNRRSLGLFSAANPIRQLFYYRCVKSKVFESIILAVILANCVILAMTDPPDEAEFIFLAVFTVEMIIKIIALGFYGGPDTYLASPWNRLDFFVVVTGYLIFVPGVGNMSAIRALRVLRALRTISVAPGLQKMVDALLVCVLGISSVMALTMAVVFVFAILGLQLYMGVLHQKCVSLPPSNSTDAEWQAWISDPDNYALSDGAFIVCGNASTALGCPTLEELATAASAAAAERNEPHTFFGVQCLEQGPNPDYGYTSFDNIGWASITVFQIITLDFWENVYNNVIFATGAASVVFFVLGIFIGAFFIFNLVLAVVAVKYDMQEEEQGSDDGPKQMFAWWPKAPEKPRDNPNKVQRLVESNEFNTFIMLVIVANTIAMCCYYAQMPESMENDLFIANLVFTGIFIVEVILKMCADGVLGYFGTSWNVFDFVVVLASIVEGTLQLAGSSSVGFLSVLRIFRLFRVIRLAQHWETMGHLISTIGRSLGQVGNLCLVMLIIMYLFAVMGMQLFGEYYQPHKFPDDEVPRWNFIDFQHSFLLVFRILCGEWIEPLWDTMLATSEAAALYYMVVIVVGNFILLNLFLALLLSSFDEEQADEIEDSKDDGEELEDEGDQSPEPVASSKRAAGPNSTVATMKSSFDVGSGIGGSGDSEGGVQEGDEPAVGRLSPTVFLESSRWQSFRNSLRGFLDSWQVQTIIFLVIIWSSIMLCFEDYNLRDDQAMLDLLYKLDIFFCTFFALEFVLKVTAIGFREYFTNGWNDLDFFLVVVGILALALQGSAKALNALRTLRALRPLRAISRWEGMKIVVDALIAAIPNFINVFLVSMIFWLLFAISGVQFFGGLFFKCVDGEGEPYPADVIPDRTACCGSNTCSSRVDADGNVFRWQNSNINFDNVGNAYLALFQVATFEGWMEVMQDSVDIVGYNRQPRREAQFYAYYFYVVFIVVGALFTLNLFIGVIIDNFTKLKRQLEREGESRAMFLTAEQLAILDSLRYFLQSGPTKAPPRPNDREGGFRNICYDLGTSIRFEVFIIVMIVLNMIVLALAHYHQTEEEIEVQFWLNVFFTMLFVVEAIIKLIGLGKHYFESNWNIFDFFVTVASLIDVIMDFAAAGAGAPVDPTFLRILRVLRLARLMRLVKHAEGVRKLLVTMVLSLASLVNIGILLFVVIFVFAIIGMVQFRYVKHNGALNAVVNFETFGRSLLLLFRLSTGAGWNDITESLSVQPPYCNETHWQGQEVPNGDCGDPLAAELYMSLFIAVAFLIIINMYIAVILENLEEEENSSQSTFEPADIDNFYLHWQKFDPDATQFIDKEQMGAFFSTLPKPFARLLKEQDEEMYLSQLRIPLYANPTATARNTNTSSTSNLHLRQRRGTVSVVEVLPTKAHCLDVLIATLKANGLFLLKGVSDNEAVERAIESSFRKRFPVRRHCEPVSNTAEFLQWANAATTIQVAYKRRVGDGHANPIAILPENADAVF
mmetsp:Transcript_8574/g.25632  ORF Transcript_8574/g.25632 Transcript_8574/m.25632 type:complete len:1547 (-) Transcript_8574:159-4799(-)|eukprot:CAMPEP_0206294892 /NCGR_PEP_ID=MMETSP0106_2-20121207/4889_1 /ASSEMBLY_ACC=CAM_ASM_000206 /TAXON_ID=81532 /ORGANISM="Acanthoeca-like sp., Strain 10tr" /LENGTH=1546 /DNA_ID=CAMNT_0053725537 /DNA_START=44 /DNA_END=4684 /DNA_ORIENTATION=-